MEEESGSSSKLVIAALAVLGLVMAGAPLVGVAGVALLTDMQASASGCTTSTVVAGEGSGDEATNIPNGWAPLVREAAQTAGLPVSVAAAQLQQESQWDENAVGPVLEDGTRPKGLAMFTDQTWVRYGNGGDPFDPEDALGAYGDYMADLKTELEPLADGDADELVRLTLAAYNAGPGAVQEFQGIPPYPETQQYVEKILDDGQLEFSADCQAPTGALAWDGDLGEGEWTIPLPGGKFSSGFGGRAVPGLPAWAQNHTGVDLATGAGTGPGGPVVAPTALRVTGLNPGSSCVHAREDGQDPDFVFTFCHLHIIDVAVGQRLARGDVIGVEGNRGLSTGTHLHVEIARPEAPDNTFNNPKFALDPQLILIEKGAWAA